MREGTTPKDLVRSMVTYARLVTNKSDDLERLVGRKPKNPPVEYINELKCVLQAARDQQARMEDAYNTQVHLVKPEQADEHDQAFDAKKAHVKATEAAEDILYGWARPNHNLSRAQDH